MIKDFGAGKFLTIRKKILVVAIFATLVPSLLLGWISYYHTHAVLQAKAVQELDGGLERAGRAMDSWFQEKFRGLRVFSGSFVLVENLIRHQQHAGTGNNSEAARRLAARQISVFLQLVRDQLQHYHRLLVLDRSGTVVAQFPDLETPTGLENGWVGRLSPDRTVLSETGSGREAETARIVLGVPIVSATGADLGLLAAEIPLSKLSATLEFSTDAQAELLLARTNGEILLSSHSWKRGYAPGSSVGYRPNHNAAPPALERYANHQGVDVVSRALLLPQLRWRLVLEKPYRSVFAEVDRLRDIALMLTLTMLAGFGLLAYLVSQSILLPLSRLTLAAAAVAEGNLSVQLETDNRDELGFTMAVFNDMVRRLRVGRDKLEKLTITDSLTGLYNRKQIMDTLALQFSRYRRSGTRFSVLMVDIDHFKRINDRHGHQAGDAALQQIGTIFRSVLRSTDVAGRYGGEEFLIILEQTGERQALETAERIRTVTEQCELRFREGLIRISVSIGIATVAAGGDETPAGLIQRADRCLYMAKQRGRNRVIAAGLNVAEKSPGPAGCEVAVDGMRQNPVLADYSPAASGSAGISRL
ncbi:MAG: GGDEF domain-containing protein [Gammaproteobacteria bacterium]|nr:GGDEF domain-containing protein [Gammaproteobacteria bacterium]